MDASPAKIPKSPSADAKIIKGNLSRRTEMARLKIGVAKEEIPVSATTTTIAADTSPALRAASPMTKAPIMLTACPKITGSRIPASLRSSNTISIRIASTTAGKGIWFLCAAMLKIKGVGSSSW